MKRERNISEDLKLILSSYPLLTPSCIAEAGWPDKLIQMPDSRIIPCEIKLVSVNKTGYYLLSELRQEQVAWLAKWQYHGGKCFVFVGLLREDEFIGYHCIIVKEWNDWLLVNKNKYYLDTTPMDKLDVLMWFEHYAFEE